MIKTLLKLLGCSLGGLLMLLPCLRGFYQLHFDPEKARHTAREYLLEVAADLDDYAEDHGGRYPMSINALGATDRARQGTGIGHVWGGLLRAPLRYAWSNFRQSRQGALLDPWGTPYVYRVSPDGDAMRLESLGPDRRSGGIEEDADLILSKRGRDTSFSFLGQDPIY